MGKNLKIISSLFRNLWKRNTKIFELPECFLPQHTRTSQYRSHRGNRGQSVYIPTPFRTWLLIYNKHQHLVCYRMRSASAWMQHLSRLKCASSIKCFYSKQNARNDEPEKKAFAHADGAIVYRWDSSFSPLIVREWEGDGGTEIWDAELCVHVCAQKDGVEDNVTGRASGHQVRTPQ